MMVSNTSIAQVPNTSTHLSIPEPVERMREGLLACCGDLDASVLRELLDADETCSLETALDRWLLKRLDLDDERIAQALFHVLSRRFFDELKETLQ